MKILLCIILLSISAAFAKAESQEAFTERYEGRRHTSYMDTTGHLTVGIGHRINKRVTWTDAQIEAAFAHDVQIAKRAVKRQFSTFDTMPEEMRLILVDMAFQLGETGLSRFVKFHAAVESKDWQRAANELIDSKWYLQSGRRSKHHADYFRTFKGE